MENITSAQNARVKSWAKLQTKKGRQASQTYLLDGWHLVQEAINHDGKLHAVMATAEQLEAHMADVPHGVPIFQITDDIAKKLSDLVTPQGIFAEVTMPSATRDPHFIHDGAWLFLDGIQDPGNVGTMVRTADAAGFAGVVFGEGSVDMYSPKALRAMQGSQFHVQTTTGDLKEWTTAFVDNGINVYGTQLDPEAADLFMVEPQTQFGLIMGNEGQGMDAELAAATSQNLYIPLTGQAESLNVGVAAGIAMFALKAR
ncbi:TrmH family RNA methyltransferase [Weissella soli]|jgi:TrmH family RNA methyltransferase|uniref:TrmH family RNA methyltransferase n=1 Tax=Weissella soli TaxID=155866 RepID=A0A288Q9V0_9LACO|nr:RNA methyltransferase [Weissella soli]AOT55822.1 putative tRNA/rRNA methyltransferase YsgA [Weissella soli]MCT8394458.1 RNA methyltransferase [Weissella soli]NKY83635.1 RNA methyltransferase [Weissella soli]QEA35247.1 RNA methyltransferase [Weissella soli]RDL06504.1 TrmH family RNA methyltransferase [Weissella soli]